MANARSTMYYGGLQENKMLRPLRKHYSADGSMEIKQNMLTGETEIITYIGGDGYSAPVVLKSDGTTQEYLYLHRDYQGTILAITNQAGDIVEKRLFDAWGAVVKIQDGAGNTLSQFAVLDRGYTGHEHLQGVNLIHMNGRLYDPVLHRFLQPDNYVQDLYNPQNYNRYGYVLNNPLRYTDYSGESFKSWWAKNWKTVVVVVAAVATAIVIVTSLGTATPLVAGIWAGAGAGFVGGALGTALDGGSFKESMLSGFKGAALGALAGGLGAFAAGFAPVGAYYGAAYAGTTNVVIGGIINTIQDKPFFEGAALSVTIGLVTGGYTGYKAAQNQGLNPMTGTPKASTIAKNINESIDEAQVAFDKSVREQAASTTKANTAVVEDGVVDVSNKTGFGIPVDEELGNQLQAKFKHASDFGVEGNYNKANLAKFDSAIDQHMNSADIRIINGTYRGQSVIHYLNPNNGLNVITTPSGQFLSGWKLNPLQLENVLNRGSL
ncbi:MAG TPA: colicin D domain-containing protein [Flavobacterium sp.]